MLKKFLSLGMMTLVASLLLEAVFLPVLALGKTIPQNSMQTEYYLAQNRTYKVKLGDTLSGIAVKTGIDLDKLLSYNPSLSSNPNLIQIGQVIYLNKTSLPSPTATKTPSKRQSVAFKGLPTERRTGSNRNGARRGSKKDECRVNPDDALRLLLPNTNFGYTLQDYPTVFWYMPQLKSAPTNLELLISPKDKESYKIYQFTTNNKQAGVMSLTLPPELGPLEEGKEYTWEIRLYCSSETFIFANGNIQRLSTNDPQLESDLEGVSIENYPAILAREGVWYDALSILAALRQQKPTDPNLIKDWSNVMEMIGFKNIASVPLLSKDGK